MNDLDTVREAWGAWPIVPPNADRYVIQALHSRRWAISSIVTQDAPELFEQRFAREFAAYLEVPTVVPTDHGSSALVMALTALGLPSGSHVVVPALTWVATATAVFRAGYVPVVCDVDSRTGTMTAEALRAALTPRTRAVIVVHWACTMADMDALLAVAAEAGLPVVEDAAQAHGALWRDRAAGALGDLGCFSLQQAKVLSVGEGGAVVSRHASWRTRLEELRADSRSWRPAGEVRVGDMALAETAGIMGSNFGMNDLAAALACAQLELLDAQHDIRNGNYLRLVEECERIPGVSVPVPPEQQTRLSLYEIPIRFADAAPGEAARLAGRLRETTGLRSYLPRHPLVGSSLLNVGSVPAIADKAAEFDELHRDRNYPAAEAIAASSVVLHHSAFLATDEEMDTLVSALAALAGERRR
ncbi:aminotransferase class I/II-fold pyridoxal phosphate-dependent enzyme [Xylanimonas oleitrophica]|uniref:aminotransferase class I/II-fold pyridoxal phosphate-dependent enzyme n=1 Tax=Xylanimonas oleitrophica TaxID=2607479 RepID=UPI0015CFBF02|nr:aminotransferase class I/II-fold pyridoxal phosphate-dependent enzyme [Xylanimonas oleitrophica]